ncbi:MAG TPA: hypothetical protein VHI52_17475, partial [Verrucomicrobiae bacterium]|nr:hypothetical protein [Verrucomicrobiae bacterium]
VSGLGAGRAKPSACCPTPEPCASGALKGEASRRLVVREDHASAHGSIARREIDGSPGNGRTARSEPAAPRN